MSCFAGTGGVVLRGGHKENHHFVCERKPQGKPPWDSLFPTRQEGVVRFYVGIRVCDASTPRPHPVSRQSSWPVLASGSHQTSPPVDPAEYPAESQSSSPVDPAEYPTRAASQRIPPRTTQCKLLKLYLSYPADYPRARHCILGKIHRRIQRDAWRDLLVSYSGILSGRLGGIHWQAALADKLLASCSGGILLWNTQRDTRRDPLAGCSGGILGGIH